MELLIANHDDATSSDEWSFGLKPEDTIVPRYQTDVLESNQPRAAKAHRRHLRQETGQLHRSLWLPRLRLDGPNSPPLSDSEGDAPRRGRLIYPTLNDESNRWGERGEEANLSFVAHHQKLERTHPDTSPHSCSYCRCVSVDLRRQRAYQFEPAGEQRPKGWRVQPSRTGFTFGEALVAADKQCPFFLFVVRTLRIPGSSMEVDDSFEVTVTGMVQVTATLGFSLQRRDQKTTTQRHNPTQSLTLYTVPGNKPLHETIGYYLPPNLLPNSKLSFCRARSWLEACDKGHGNCIPHASASTHSYMPKRVLEIDSAFPALRTRLVTNAPVAPYAALSYCWGGDQMAKTVKARIPEYETDIPVQSLPQTIYDALVVAQGIGLRYLWVDAMCIIQDDGDDMAEQIGQMYAVYRSAYVTISAATAATSKDARFPYSSKPTPADIPQGFLHPRTDFRPFTLSARLDDNVFGHVIASPEPKSTLRRGNDIDHPLFKRGWTYQEHQLSPRILIYGRTGVTYWCAESSHRDGGSEHPHWQDQNEYATLLFYNAQLGTSGAAIHHPRSWGDRVENYTQRNLTVDSDKLLAIAAVAEQYAHLAPVTDYLAGLWREDLLLQCLWRTWDPEKARHPKAYRAPSWSWAALDGDIYPWTPPDEAKSVPTISCELIRAETTLCSPKMRFGAVSGGVMRVRAKMRRVLWFNYDEYRGGRYQALNFRHGRDPGASDDELALLWQMGGGDPRLTLSIDVRGDWEANEEIVLWSMEVYSSGDGDDDVDGEGLLLRNVTDGSGAGADSFQRVGKIAARRQEYMPEPDWFNERETEWLVISIL